MITQKFQDIQWEKAYCHLCSSGNTAEPVLLEGKPLTEGQFGYDVHPVICQCGLVYLSPRWTPETYHRFYVDFYDPLYRLELKDDYGKQGVRDNMAAVWRRSSPHLDKKRIRHILDVGCGSGYGLEYLREEVAGAQIFGIEASPDCCRILQEEVGAALLDSDVDGPWVDDHRQTFDFIVMRHVVEHFLNPVESLSRLRSTLAPGGSLYIAVPDMMHPRTVLRDYEKWWEYYFRAVHPYYYCRETLFLTLERAGLYPFAFGEENEEVWCLVSSEKRQETVSSDLFSRQMKVLQKNLP